MANQLEFKEVRIKWYSQEEEAWAEAAQIRDLLVQLRWVLEQDRGDFVFVQNAEKLFLRCEEFLAQAKSALNAEA